MGYCSEEDVYEECGMNSTTIANLAGKTTAEITALVSKYIESGDKKIKRILKVPTTVRKEEHQFFKNKTVSIGPYEDSLEFFGQWNPQNCVESVTAIFSDWGEGISYYPNNRRVLPYPTNCDDLTEDKDDYTQGSSCTLAEETSIVKAGDVSIKATFSSVVAGENYFQISANANMNLIIYVWKFFSFWFRTNDKTVTYTVEFRDVDGNAKSTTFNATLNNTWEIISLDMDDFSGIDWAVTPLQSVRIYASADCIIYFDNANWNDGLFWTLPEGLICWADPSSEPLGAFSVTYSFDPYANETPEDVIEASAKIASVKILDYCIGARQRYAAFQVESQSMESTPDKETLYVTRQRIKKEVMEILAEIGVGTNESVGAIV